MTEPLSPAALLARLAAMTGPGRRLVALAGPPGSGKSTLAAQLVARLNGDGNGDGAPRAAILAMDGYHYDDGLLAARGLLARKGAPETFDTGGLAAMLARLRADAEDEIAVPVFDRTIEIARAGAAVVPRAARLVLVEGNYVLLDREPWRGLAASFDLSVLLAVPEPVLRTRLARRWRGLGLSPEAIRARVEGNDLPNGRALLAASRAPDFVVDATLPLD
jgi:pantothenate kinase